MSDAFGGTGQMLPPHNNSEVNRTAFQTQMINARLRTMGPVRVLKVYKQDGKTVATRGEIAGAGFLDVQPVVSQIDGAGQRMDHVTVYHVPYTRIYGGDGAIINDPVIGDIGYIHCSDRDISTFKDQIRQGSTQNVLPGSQRRHDMADSLYVGGVLNKAPKQYLAFVDNGITINDANKNNIVMNKSGIVITDTNNNVITMNKGGITITDDNGNTIVLNSSGITITDDNSNSIVLNSGGIEVATQGIVYLGGTGGDGAYDFVLTPSGPSSNVKAKL